MNNAILMAVDDKPDNLFVLEQLIATYCPECRVVTAQNAEAGLAIAAETPLDVAVIDVQMPGMDGIEMCRRLKSDDATANMPVILLTAHKSTPQLKVKGLDAGADDFITKPVDSHELIAKIKVMLRIKKAEDTLRRDRDKSEERYRLLFNTMLHGFALFEIIRGNESDPPDYRFTEVNPAFEILTGLKSEEVTGKGMKEVLPKTGPSWTEIFGEAAKGNSARFESYFWEFDKYFEGVAYCPQPGQVAIIFDDATERKHLESQLRQAQKMEAIGTLAGGIAHDFNNILFPIIGYTEMSMDHASQDNRLRKNLTQVLNAANRARELVQQILTFSRQTDKELKPLILQPIIKEIVKLLRASLPSTIHIRYSMDDKCGPVMADPVQIHQIIMNLSTNAYHAMAENGGTLEVSLRETELGPNDFPDMQPGPYMKLSVTDTGQGMTDEITERIFDPYFTTKEKDKGTGLGLSIVHGIAKSHNGHISVYSKPGQGSAFHIWLPLIESSPPAQKSLPEEPLQGGRERILLVDDEEQIVSMQKQMLGRLGYKVTGLTDSLETLKIFQKHPADFDLVITDTTMPNLTGVELAGEMMRIRPDIPIIICSGFSEHITEEKAKAMGIREYAMKPVPKDKLARMIRRILDETTVDS
ncbi:response regulator [Desulfobacterales bacterium HSG2]|nr:response regulator [Desulfobacterales bacterium HSG2]